MHFIDVNTLLISKSCVCSSVVVFTNIRMTMANANTDDFSGYDSEATEAVSNEFRYCKVDSWRSLLIFVYSAKSALR
jgi:hypothetical protein